jgi:hypothetical protein
MAALEPIIKVAASRSVVLILGKLMWRGIRASKRSLSGRCALYYAINAD